MNEIDLEQFQFDYDQTWAALFLHSDGTVFARYGSRTAEGPMAVNSMSGLQTTMKRVLNAHEGYPENRERYVAKRGPRRQYRWPKEIPSPTIKKVIGNNAGKSKSCVHCHNVYDGLHEVLQQENRYDPDKLWKYPLPQNLGMTVAATTENRVAAVAVGSAAAKAGLLAGDIIQALNGQAILSLADIQFVLHHLPDAATLEVEAKRDDVTREFSVDLKPGWRRTDNSWRVSMYGMPPRPRLWVQALSSDRKSALGITVDKMAIEVRGVFGKAVRNSGLKKGDVVVQSGEHAGHVSEGEFHSDIRLNYYRPGSVLDLKVLRNGETEEISVKF